MFYSIDFNAASLNLIEDAIIPDTHAPTRICLPRKSFNAIWAWILGQLPEHGVNGSDYVFR